tara:strand:+ start:147 stop:329 length:183 start_codon:yes stop_codon:yes gene_type:complete
MTEQFQDIETLEEAIIALTEGASDEKRMAIVALHDMLDRKRSVVQQFESELEDMFDNVSG